MPRCTAGKRRKNHERDGKTFKEAYGTCFRRHAQTLRSQQEPDIDNLTTIVTESVEALTRSARRRIDAVEKALEESLGAAQVESDAGSGAQRSKRSGSSGDPGEDDDVSF